MFTLYIKKHFKVLDLQKREKYIIFFSVFSHEKDSCYNSFIHEIKQKSPMKLRK